MNYSQITVDVSRITLPAPACEKNPTIFLPKHTIPPSPNFYLIIAQIDAVTHPNPRNRNNKIFIEAIRRPIERAAR